MDSHTKRLENLTSRLTSVANHLQSSGNKSAAIQQQHHSSAGSVDHLPIVADYEAIIHGSFRSFASLSRQIGGEVSSMTDHVTRLFDAQKDFLRQAIQTRKPANDQQMKDLIKPQSSEIEAITGESFFSTLRLGFDRVSSVAVTNQHRKSPLFNHLSAISEGIPAFGWILVSPTPAPHIREMSDAAQFYANRVLKEFKEKDPVHAEWVKQWMKILTELHAYVKQYHTTGLSWGAYLQRDTGVANRNGTGGTSAPPPPPAESFSKMQMDEGASRNGLMSSINSLGTGVTSHLKRVPDELKLHKNPQLREQPVEKPIKSAVSRVEEVCLYRLDLLFQPASSTKPSAATPGPPKLALEGNKWIVEYYSHRSDLKISETSMRHTIYIYKCSDCTITVQGKVNSIVLDQCTKVGLQFSSVVSLVEFINCRSMKAQVLEHVPTIQIEKTDGCHVYLSKSSLNTEFITSKSSEMTINVPADDGEYKEYPIPEQFKTHIQNKKQLVTVPNESSGV